MTNEKILFEVPLSVGELLDKITILEIKSEKITDKSKLKNINNELNLLNSLISSKINMTKELTNLISNLKSVNLELWQIEDDIRDKERDKVFDDSFVQLARSVYITNDKRAKLKYDINALLGSELVEEKSYSGY